MNWLAKFTKPKVYGPPAIIQHAPAGGWEINHAQWQVMRGEKEVTQHLYVNPDHHALAAGILVTLERAETTTLTISLLVNPEQDYHSREFLRAMDRHGFNSGGNLNHQEVAQLAAHGIHHADMQVFLVGMYQPLETHQETVAAEVKAALKKLSSTSFLSSNKGIRAAMVAKMQETLISLRALPAPTDGASITQSQRT